MTLDEHSKQPVNLFVILQCNGEESTFSSVSPVWTYLPPIYRMLGSTLVLSWI